MLLSVLGEYVAPGREEVYRDALVRALEALGFKTDAARQALARSVTAGWLRSRRVGRRSLMTLGAETQAMLDAGYPRIYSFGAPRAWDGRWLLAVVRVPEDRREVRDRLRTRLAWAGLGSLGGGLWISPHTDREREILQASDDEAAELLVFSAEQLHAQANGDRLVTQAWDLEAIAGRYEEFVEAFGAAMPETDEAAFVAQTRMVHEWRKFPLLDPELPIDLLPRDWPREAARAMFVDRHERWRGSATAFFASLNR